MPGIEPTGKEAGRYRVDKSLEVRNGTVLTKWHAKVQDGDPGKR